MIYRIWENCVGYMQILHHLYKGLEHPRILVFLGVLEPVSQGQLRDDSSVQKLLIFLIIFFLLK